MDRLEKRLRVRLLHRTTRGLTITEVGRSFHRHTQHAGGRSIHVTGVFATNDLELLRVTAMGGRGIAVLPRGFVEGDLESGALVHVLSGIVEAHMKAAIVYPDRELKPPAVRAFIDEMLRWKLL